MVTENVHSSELIAEWDYGDRLKYMYLHMLVLLSTVWDLHNINALIVLYAIIITISIQ